MNSILQSLGLNGQILIGQIINITILIILFKYLLGDTIIREITKKRALIKKLENADEAYDDLISKAKKEADELRKEGQKKRDELIGHAEGIGEKRKQELIDQGHQKADSIIESAEAKAKLLEQEMEKGFEDAVKTVSDATIRKIFGDKKDLQEEYIKNIIKEVKNQA